MFCFFALVPAQLLTHDAIGMHTQSLGIMRCKQGLTNFQETDPEANGCLQ